MQPELSELLNYCSGLYLFQQLVKMAEQLGQGSSENAINVTLLSIRNLVSFWIQLHCIFCFTKNFNCCPSYYQRLCLHHCPIFLHRFVP